VSQRKAPGAISAIALKVSPVRPRVGFMVGAVGVVVSAMVNKSFEG